MASVQADLEKTAIHMKAVAAMDWVSETVRAMVDHPGRIAVDRRIEGSSVEIVCYCATQDDMGKLIGKQGRNARCIRTLLNARGRTEGVAYRFDIELASELVQ
jgi:predicted RNA-binding protein YlqC (UPF0109 family)